MNDTAREIRPPVQFFDRLSPVEPEAPSASSVEGEAAPAIATQEPAAAASVEADRSGK